MNSLKRFGMYPATRICGRSLTQRQRRCFVSSSSLGLTPFVQVDEETLLGNIKRMQMRANQNGVVLRPHIKTHKSLHIANLQVDNGAIGITASKPEEALVFLEQGFNVLVAYPVLDPAQLGRLTKYSDQVTLMFDSEEGLNAIVSSALKAKTAVKVVIKVNVGLGRCGVSLEKFEALVRRMIDFNCSNSIQFQGIISHAGHAYGAKNAEECLEICNQEVEIMRSAKAILASYKLNSFVSVGCTLTEHVRTDYDGIDEIRPGNYVFNDLTPFKKGLIEESDIAVAIISRVISANHAYAIVDSGSKVLSSDGGAHGTAADGFGVAMKLDDTSTKYNVEKLSEEHGWVTQSGKPPLKVNDILKIFPNHSCPVLNLTNRYCLQRRDKSCEYYPVDARGEGNTPLKNNI